MMKIDFEKGDGLIPAIVQDVTTKTVLMLGYMNRESYDLTQKTGKVTFYSRSRQEIWTKGETSGHFLFVKSIQLDCDADTLLVKASPQGPVCHTGQDTCFNDVNDSKSNFLSALETIIDDRRYFSEDTSYTAKLFKKGVNAIAQKVGEEATEVVIEAVSNNNELLLEESADLLFHLLVLLAAKDLKLQDVISVLEKRHK